MRQGDWGYPRNELTRWTSNVFLRTISYLLIFSIYFVYTTGHFDHNDFMYSAASAASGRIYQDVHFVQAPLSYIFLKFLSFLSPPGLHYTVLRLASVVLSFSALLIVAECCISSSTASIALVLLGATNYHFASAATEIGSYALPMFLVACSTAILFRSRSDIGLASAGLLVGLAISAKLNYAFFAAPIVVAAYCMQKRGLRRPVFGLVSTITGIAIGLIPVWLVLFQNPHAFYSHNIIFHSTFTAAFRGLNVQASAKSLWGELANWLGNGGIYYLFIFAAANQLREDRTEWGTPNLPIYWFLIAAFASAISPMAGFVQYYVPVSFFAIFAAINAIDNGPSSAILGRRFELSMIGGAIFCQQLLLFLPEAYTAARQGSAIAEVNRINRQVNTALAGIWSNSCSPSIFTLSGSFILDSGFKPTNYTEGGPFWARLSGYIPYRYLADPSFAINPYLINPKSFILNTDEASGVLTGFYASQPDSREQDIRDAAASKDFILVGQIPTRLSKHPLELWARLACLTRKPV